VSHPTDPESNPTVAHEHTDADAHAITRFGIGLAFILVVSQLLLWWVFHHFSERETKLSPHVSAMIKAQAPTLPPEPRLQGNAPLDLHPRLDLQQMRREEDDVLNHYAWIDPDHGVVRLPIERALELISLNGLPKFKVTEQKQDGVKPKGTR
jgi:hypothetical protein